MKLTIQIERRAKKAEKKAIQVLGKPKVDLAHKVRRRMAGDLTRLANTIAPKRSNA